MTTVLGLISSAILSTGIYQTEGGRGSLELTEYTSNSFKFKIETLGGNGHSCSISGIIEQGVGVSKVEDGSPDKPCEVKFSSTGSSVEISYDAGNESCRYHCGMRATFDGTFIRTDSACLPKAVRKVRNDFKKAYDKKKYKEAWNLLAPLHKLCSNNLLWYEEQSMRNDMAITQFHLNDLSGCLATLKPLEALAAMSDQTIREHKAQFEAEQDVKTAKATRTNLKKCKGGIKKK